MFTLLRKIRENLIFTTLCAILALGPLQAQMLTDRPDQTESAATVGRGMLQIESGILWGGEGEGPSKVEQLLLPTNLFRYGLTKAVELRFLAQFESLKTSEGTNFGFSDLEIGTKIQVLRKGGRNTEVAFLSHLLIPTASRTLTNDRFGTINKISIAHQLSDRMGLGYNLGYDYFGTGNGDLTYSLSLGIGLTEKVAVYIEPYGALANLETYLLNADTGFTYLARPNLQFDFSLGTGINHRMHYISVGLSWSTLKD